MRGRGLPGTHSDVRLDHVTPRTGKEKCAAEVLTHLAGRNVLRHSQCPEDAWELLDMLGLIDTARPVRSSDEVRRAARRAGGPIGDHAGDHECDHGWDPHGDNNSSPATRSGATVSCHHEDGGPARKGSVRWEQQPERAQAI